jgi:hypothetical protein
MTRCRRSRSGQRRRSWTAAGVGLMSAPTSRSNGMSAPSVPTSSSLTSPLLERLLQDYEELLARSHAQTSLAAYIDYLETGFRPAHHHRLLIQRLEAVARGEIPRLMVCMPPGSAKSTYVSCLLDYSGQGGLAGAWAGIYTAFRKPT